MLIRPLSSRLVSNLQLRKLLVVLRIELLQCFAFRRFSILPFPLPSFRLAGHIHCTVGNHSTPTLARKYCLTVIFIVLETAQRFIVAVVVIMNEYLLLL